MYTGFAHHDQDKAHRAYWTEQMQLGDAFVEQLRHFGVCESNEPFADLRGAAESDGVEMHFSDSMIAGDLPRVFHLRESLVSDVVEIGHEMNRRGWILQIEDGFRSLEMQRQLVRKPEIFDAILEKCIWENSGMIPEVDVLFRRTMVLVANIPKIGTHMSGSAIDISVFYRDDGCEVWRGDPYLTMSERTPMRSPFVEAQALERRLEITAILERHGFIHYPFEFWHYSKGDAMAHLLTGSSLPARYGPVHWDSQTNEVTAVENPLSPLNPLAALEREISAAIERGSQRLRNEPVREER